MLDERYFDLESIPPAVLVALEELGRIERAVYMLHSVFRRPLREIASALNMTEEAVRDALRYAVQRTSE